MIDPGELADAREYLLATSEAVARDASPEEHVLLRKTYSAKVVARWETRLEHSPFDSYEDDYGKD
ncbi:hypothetical protein C3B59_03895 [Cryobacterium zongtaii]|uniref:Uncharacterized protein n=1 Tax=Cryobacterium zongtaii TaxID=1259217 RepID=A0A2S3ZNQ6_9MICO|nr:hypothetical protein [Cryobacterium zongtaii]POH70819.1 hypothetical protein C3B59_03895 [Cryobacterium zongtaii]